MSMSVVEQLITLLMVYFVLSGGINETRYAVTNDIPPDCVYVNAEIVDKGRVVGDEEGLQGLHYFKIIGVAIDSQGEEYNNSKFKLYVNPITYSQHDNGSVYEKLICNIEEYDEFIYRLNMILEQDWFNTWDGGDFTIDWIPTFGI